MSRYRLTPLSVGILQVAPLVLVVWVAPNRDAAFWVLLGRLVPCTLLWLVRRKAARI